MAQGVAIINPSSAKVSLPPGVASLIATAKGERGDTGIVTADARWRPPVIGADLVAEIAGKHLPALEGALEPATRPQVAGVLVVLLAMFYIPNRPQALENRIAKIWAEDLSAYPLWAIEDAAREWRRTKDRRPTLAEFLRECEFWVSDTRADRDLLRRLVAAHPTSEIPATTH